MERDCIGFIPGATRHFLPFVSCRERDNSVQRGANWPAGSTIRPGSITNSRGWTRKRLIGSGCS